MEIDNRVGIIGAGGKIGNRVAARFLGEGFEVHAWNRTESKIKTLAELGAIILSTPREIAENTNIVFDITEIGRAHV